MLPSGQTHIGKILRSPLALIPPNLRAVVLRGRLRGTRWIVGSHTHGCWIGNYERNAQALFEECIRPGDVVYDVGANVGFFTLLAARLAGPRGSVVAFEPLPANLEYLREHVRMNAAHTVSVLDVAVAAAPGEGNFAVRGRAVGGLSAEGEIKVRVSSIDALVESRVIPPPDFIKIDIEGGEDAALAGARKTLEKHHPRLLVGLHNWQAQDSCIEQLRSLGYQLVKPLPGATRGVTGPVAIMDGHWRSDLSP